MTIVRADRSQSSPWFVASRETAQDAQLSYRARGLLLYILSKPDGWEIQEEDLVKNATEGRDAIRTALAELKAAGYLVVQRLHNPDTGKFTYIKTVHERPADPPSTGNQELVNRRRETRNGKPGTGKPSTGNQELESRPLIDQRERVEIRELERESREREAAPPAAEPAPPTAAHAPQLSPAEQAFSDLYPKAKLTPEQRTAIRETVTDMARWQDLLALWKRNGWRPLIGNLLDRYAKDAPTAATDVPALPPGWSDRVLYDNALDATDRARWMRRLRTANPHDQPALWQRFEREAFGSAA